MKNYIQPAKTFADFLQLLAFNFPDFFEFLTAVTIQFRMLLHKLFKVGKGVEVTRWYLSRHKYVRAILFIRLH